jgi:hypothetical protein
MKINKFTTHGGMEVTSTRRSDDAVSASTDNGECARAGGHFDATCVRYFEAVLKVPVGCRERTYV